MAVGCFKFFLCVVSMAKNVRVNSLVAALYFPYILFPSGKIGGWFQPRDVVLATMEEKEDRFFCYLF